MSKKSKLFEDLLRKVVREELTNVLRSELKQLTEKEENLSLTTMLDEEEKKPTFKKPAVGSRHSAKVKLSNNPLLENLINSSSPIPGQGLASDFISPETIPTQQVVGVEGKPVNLNNPAVQDTLDIINRDYSSLMSELNKK